MLEQGRKWHRASKSEINLLIAPFLSTSYAAGTVVHVKELGYKEAKSSSGLEKLAERPGDSERELRVQCGSRESASTVAPKGDLESSPPLLLKFSAISMAAFAVSVGLTLCALFLQGTCGVGVLEWWNLGAVS